MWLPILIHQASLLWSKFSLSPLLFATILNLALIADDLLILLLGCDAFSFTLFLKVIYIFMPVPLYD